MQAKLDPEASQAGSDRRRHPRYRLSTAITIRCADGASIPGISIEISESGISAITADPLKVNDIVELEPVAEGRISALVRHNVGRIYGFEFINQTPDQAQRIQETCKMLPVYRANSLGI